MIDKVHKIWEDKQIAVVLLMDIKRAFNYVSQSRLIQKIDNLCIDDNLIGWTQLFLTDKSVQLVIDGITIPK